MIYSVNNPDEPERDPCRTGSDLSDELGLWRETLAKEISRRSHGIHGGDPDLAVLKIISGILFLRICEEKGIEPYGTLGSLIGNEDRFPQFCSLLRRTEARYGTGLFDPAIPGKHPPGFLSDLVIGDDLFGRIISGAYPPDERIDFGGITSDALAEAYDRLLEKTIRISGRRLAIKGREESIPRIPLPPDVTRDMVEQTVGRKSWNSTPRDLSSYRILDPACGTGNFLLQAYRFLLSWHREWYIRNLVPLLQESTSIASPGILAILPGNGKNQEGTGGSRFNLPIRRVGETNGSGSPPEWKLTLAEKKRILTSSLHGVDSDRRAVEATKFALLLELLADENESSVSTELMLSGMPLLPLLDRNFKCGNPLVGTDYSGSAQSPPYDYRERTAINPFDWSAEFPGVFERGGFDLVIGNPQNGPKEYRKGVKTYLQTHYRVYHDDAGNIPFYIEKGLSLLREEGQLSYVTRSSWLRSAAGKPLRRLVKEIRIEEIVTIGGSKCSGNEHLCMFRFANSEPGIGFPVADLGNGEVAILRRCVQSRGLVFPQHQLTEGGWTFIDKRPGKLVEKIKRAGRALEGYVMGRIRRGGAVHRGEAVLIGMEEKDRLLAGDPRIRRFIRPFVEETGISRYGYSASDTLMALVIPPGTKIRKYRGLAKILAQKSGHGLPEGSPTDFPATGKPENPGAISGRAQSGRPEYPGTPNIIFSGGIPPSFALDESGIAVYAEDVFVIPDDQKYLLAILNSGMMRVYAKFSGGKAKGRVMPNRIASFPIYTPDFENPEDVVRHDRLETLVSKMIDLNRRIAQSGVGSDTTALRELARAADREIDTIVCDLYGLTVAERNLIDDEITGTPVNRDEPFIGMNQNPLP